MSTLPLDNFYTFPKIMFISKVQLLNLLDRVQRSWAALATIQCGHHTGFPPSVTSPGCRSVVVARAVGGVAVRGGGAAVVATVVVTTAPVPPTRLSIGFASLL